ncbi:rCG28053 [Rattus norvegicus]|uniref:RCG28053 n=1 Tax=Rattus norvegicus TaxID=10116 RepID=A6IE45_RAT|nr:rCG28053 [Rattus norvegicus]
MITLITHVVIYDDRNSFISNYIYLLFSHTIHSDYRLPSPPYTPPRPSPLHPYPIRTHPHLSPEKSRPPRDIN